MISGSTVRNTTSSSGARGRLAVLAAVAVGLLGLVQPGSSSAQYFGQNKVQYKSFHWSILKTEHFDVHYYTGEEEADQNPPVMAERGYHPAGPGLDHQIKVNNPVVLSASHTHVEQNHITPQLLGAGTG